MNQNTAFAHEGKGRCIQGEFRDRVRDHPTLSATATLVGWAIGTRLNERGHTFVGQSQLAIDCKTSIPTVRKGLLELEAAGLILRTYPGKTPGKNGKVYLHRSARIEVVHDVVAFVARRDAVRAHKTAEARYYTGRTIHPPKGPTGTSPLLIHRFQEGKNRLARRLEQERADGRPDAEERYERDLGRLERQVCDVLKVPPKVLGPRREDEIRRR